MSIVVSKSPSEVVRPSEPVKMDTRKINLSSFDKPLVIAPTVVLQVFEHPIHDPVETIRRALSQALVHYYPIAGRFAVDDDDDVHIDCTGEGVTFVAASANCTILELMRDIDDRAPDAATTVLRKLVVDYPAMGFGRGDPFVLMQVTAFSCGGFVVGVTWNHGVADGFGIAQFLQAVGELARGLPTPLIVPVRSDKVTQAISPSFVESAKQFMFGVTVPSKLALHNITISSKLINSIRGPSCTVFEAVAAALWRCRTRVVMSDPEAPTVLAFTVNSRKYMGVKAGYYGNCATVHVATAKSGEVAHGDIMDVVRTIRRAKQQVPEQLLKGEMLPRAVGAPGKHPIERYESALLVTSWRNIGLEDVDFGSGKTSRVMTMHEPTHIRPMCLVCLPCKGDEGAKVLSGCVTVHHSDAFLREIAML
ncbi:acyl transferase 15-like [Oryza brachyantha]|uniref:acyl transferase 15-like n=1 Tax=Oryza brachyantha TaxID=4533 RepID=UPI001ADD0FEB|nr:acyl transferase 15-like [Oryza brachyantha]